MKRVNRPKAKKGKISHKDNFELCYLRHAYLRRANYNPSKKDMQPFQLIAYRLARNTYGTYQNLFITVGLELEDLFSIAQVHLVSFLGSFALGRMPSKKKDFERVFHNMNDREPTAKDILSKDQANFTLFLKQRMEDVVRVSRQKIRNIKGLTGDEFHYYYGPKPPPKKLHSLLKDHERFGFRKIDGSVFKTIKRRAGLIHTTYFDFSGMYYVAVPLGSTYLGMKDFVGADIDPRDNEHNLNPEEKALRDEELELLEQQKEEFFNKPDDLKINIVKNFIRVHGNQKAYLDEVKAAKRMLRALV